MPEKSTLVAGIYCRISDDHREGAGLGVKRQEEDCRKLGEQRGYEVAEVYADNDASAFSGKPRDGYLRLLQDVRARRIQVILAWHPDRLHRHPRELEDFVDLLEATGCVVHTCRAGEYDLATPNGRMVARITGATARYESEHKADRIRRKHLELATNGKYGGGGRPYGYQPGALEVREPEAQIIREAAQRALIGESLGAICRDFDRRGIPGAKGGLWGVPALRRMLVSARISGRRERRRDARGQQVVIGTIVAETCATPAIISPAQSDQLRRMFGGNGRGRPGSHLLAGLARCGLCGARLVCETHGARREFTCHAAPGRGACGRIRIIAGPVEELVVGDVLDAVDGGRLAAAMRQPEDGRDLEQELLDVDRKLSSLRADLEAGRILLPEWEGGRQVHVDNRLSLERQIAERRRTLGLADLPGDLRRDWPGLALHRQRAVLAVLLDEVRIHPASRRGAKFDPGRVELRWRV